MRDNNNALYLAAKKNDLLDWKPVAPTMWCGGKDDPTVPPALHQDVFKAPLDAQGATNVVSADVDPLSRATYGEVQASTSLACHGSHNGTYAPPFCHASARRLFDTVR